MKVLEVVREYFPDASDEEIDWIVWEQTGFPSFWNIPKDGNTPEECFRKQLREFALASLGKIKHDRTG